MKEIKPKFIPERKIEQIEKLINLRFNTKLKKSDEENFMHTLLSQWLANVKKTKNPDPDILFKHYNDMLLNIFDNNAHKDVWILEYKEA